MSRCAAVEVTDRLDALVAAVEEAGDRFDPAAISLAATVIDRAGDRLSHGSAHTVIALLGATGGGKSSLINATLGSEVAATGARRPTTTSTLACVWGPDDARSLLDRLAVANRHRVPGPSPALDGLVLLDVPDHDSIEATNREEMERIAELADAQVWVTDPEKYGDEALHARLRRLRHHGQVITLVITKTDLLTAGQVKQCRADLARLLAADGIAESRIVATSTTTGAGLDELVGVLARTVSDRRAMLDRIRADVAMAASELMAAAGPGGGPDAVPRRIRQALVVELMAATGSGGITDPVWAGPSGARRARTGGAVRSAISLVTDSLPEPWPSVVRDAATPDPDRLADRLDQAVAAAGAAGAHQPRWWRAAGRIQLVLAAVAVIGLMWQSASAFGTAIRIPAPPTPTYRGVPVPAGLVIGGVLGCLLLTLLARGLGAISANRRDRRVRSAAEPAVVAVVDEVIIAPLQAELDRRNRLRARLEEAGAFPPPHSDRRTPHHERPHD
jgi:GTP-binding protein EngB required for normal cell division